MMTWRVAVLALAILVSGAVAPAVVTAGGDGVPGHRWMGLFVGRAHRRSARSARSSAPGPRRPARWGRASRRLRAQLAVAAGNRPFRALLICFVVQSAGVADDAGRGAVLRRPGAARRRTAAPTLLFACFVGPALLVMPLWTRVGARLGKRPRCVAASLLFAVGALALVAAPVLPAVAVYAVVAVIGVGYAGQQVFALAMLPDCIAYDTARTGRRQAGVFTGLWTAGETFGLALGPRHLRAGAPALRLRLLEHRHRRAPSRHGAAGRAARLHRRCPALLVAPAAAAAARLQPDPGPAATAPGGVDRWSRRAG